MERAQASDGADGVGGGFSLFGCVRFCVLGIGTTVHATSQFPLAAWQGPPGNVFLFGVTIQVRALPQEWW